MEGLSALLAGVKKTAQTDLSSHTSNKNNPHGVTAEQAGADPKGAAAAVQVNLDTHTENKSNPHNVTCDQIGAIKSSTLGKPNGPAKLDADGKLIKNQLPPVGGSRITITFEPAFQGATWTLTGGGENYSGVVDSSLKAVVPVMGVQTLYTVSASVSGTKYSAEVMTLDYFTALSVALTQFQATIIVTVDADSTVTAVCGTTTLTKTEYRHGDFHRRQSRHLDHHCHQGRQHRHRHRRDHCQRPEQKPDPGLRGSVRCLLGYLQQLHRPDPPDQDL